MIVFGSRVELMTCGDIKAVVAIVDAMCVVQRVSLYEMVSINNFIKCVLVIQFGIITSGTPTALNNNDILFTNEVIFCVTERGSSQVVWTYTSDSNGQMEENLIATSWDAATGVSTLNVNTDKQGFYQCSVTQNNGVDASFKVGVFNTRDTTGMYSIS